METWTVEKNKKKWKWEKQEDGEHEIEVLENDARNSDVFLMVCFLAFVLCLNSVVIATLFSGILHTFALKINPMVSGLWLTNEIQIVWCLSAGMVLCAQVATIIVHARLGRLIYSHTE